MDSHILDLKAKNDSTQCGQDALTSGYGWLIQGILAILVFTLLVVKRFCEPFEHRRSWLVWFYDTSKQGFGAMIIHLANVFMAEEFMGDPCTWYIVSFLLDSTVGLVLVWAGIKLCIYIGGTKGLPTLLFGEYGRPPSIRAWGHQCMLYIVILIVEKLIITLLMQIPIWNGVRDLILSPFPDPKVKVIFAVIIIPLFVNALIFWVTDNFLMLKYKKPISTDVSPIISTFNNENNLKICFRRVKTSHPVLQADESDGLLSSSPDEELLGTHEDLQGTQSPARHLTV